MGQDRGPAPVVSRCSRQGGTSSGEHRDRLRQQPYSANSARRTIPIGRPPPPDKREVMSIRPETVKKAEAAGTHEPVLLPPPRPPHWQPRRPRYPRRGRTGHGLSTPPPWHGTGTTAANYQPAGAHPGRNFPGSRKGVLPLNHRGSSSSSSSGSSICRSGPEVLQVGKGQEEVLRVWTRSVPLDS